MAGKDAKKAYTPVITDVIHRVRTHGPLSVRTLSQMLDVPPDEIRRQITAYDQDDSPSLMPAMPTYVYVALAGEEDDDDADVVTIEGDPERDVLGVEMFGASVYLPLYEAAWDLLTREPDNAELRAACEALLSEFLPGTEAWHTYAANTVADLQAAADRHREVRIVYSRAWEPGLTNRIVEPYELTVTSRGYELDAGPVQDNGRIRTFLVSRIREYEILDESFDPPADVARLIAENRRTSTVTGYLPHSGSWVLRKWAESFEKGETDGGGFTFTAQMLPPVAWRAALLLLLGGDDAYLDDEQQVAEAQRLARELAEHHGLEV